MTIPTAVLTPTRRIASIAACLVLASATCASAFTLSLDVKDTKAPTGKPFPSRSPE